MDRGEIYCVVECYVDFNIWCEFYEFFDNFINIVFFCMLNYKLFGIRVFVFKSYIDLVNK